MHSTNSRSISTSGRCPGAHTLPSLPALPTGKYFPNPPTHSRTITCAVSPQKNFPSKIRKGKRFPPALWPIPVAKILAPTPHSARRIPRSDRFPHFPRFPEGSPSQTTQAPAGQQLPPFTGRTLPSKKSEKGSASRSLATGHEQSGHRWRLWVRTWVALSGWVVTLRLPPGIPGGKKFWDFS